MERKGIVADTITYSALISACEKGGQWERALELAREIERKGIVADTITYSALITACEVSRKLQICSCLFLKALSSGTCEDMPLFVFRKMCTSVDLHSVCCSVSRTVLRVCLSEMQLGCLSVQDASIITGAFLSVFVSRSRL